MLDISRHSKDCKWKIWSHSALGNYVFLFEKSHREGEGKQNQTRGFSAIARKPKQNCNNKNIDSTLDKINSGDDLWFINQTDAFHFVSGVNKEAGTGFKPATSGLPYWCSTIWAIHMYVNLLEGGGGTSQTLCNPYMPKLRIDFLMCVTMKNVTPTRLAWSVYYQKQQLKVHIHPDEISQDNNESSSCLPRLAAPTGLPWQLG